MEIPQDLQQKDFLDLAFDELIAEHRWRLSSEFRQEDQEIYQRRVKALRGLCTDLCSLLLTSENIDPPPEP